MDQFYVKQGEYGKGKAGDALVLEAVKRYLAANGKEARVSREGPAAFCPDPAADPAAMEVVRPAEGKPALTIPGLFFSVSHSGDVWMCLFSDRECGLDFQVHDDRDTNAVAARMFRAGELTYLSEADADRSGRFFDLWAMREAYGKYTGRGMFGVPDLAPDGIPLETVRADAEAADGNRAALHFHRIDRDMIRERIPDISLTQRFSCFALTAYCEPPEIVAI